MNEQDVKKYLRNMKGPRSPYGHIELQAREAKEAALRAEANLSIQEAEVSTVKTQLAEQQISTQDLVQSANDVLQSQIDALDERLLLLEKVARK